MLNGFIVLKHISNLIKARTGYPFIDAIMTQLKTEGWIHHLARHAVASFLPRGDLWISWESGQEVKIKIIFQKYILIDISFPS